MPVISDGYLSVSQPGSLLCFTALKMAISEPLNISQVTLLMSILPQLIHYLHLASVIHLVSREAQVF